MGVSPLYHGEGLSYPPTHQAKVECLINTSLKRGVNESVSVELDAYGVGGCNQSLDYFLNFHKRGVNESISAERDAYGVEGCRENAFIKIPTPMLWKRDGGREKPNNRIMWRINLVMRSKTG